MHCKQLPAPETALLIVPLELCKYYMYVMRYGLNRGNAVGFAYGYGVMVQRN